jgi:hypothetical protein
MSRLIVRPADSVDDITLGVGPSGRGSDRGARAAALFILRRVLGPATRSQAALAHSPHPAQGGTAHPVSPVCQRYSSSSHPQMTHRSEYGSAHSQTAMLQHVVSVSPQRHAQSPHTCLAEQLPDPTRRPNSGPHPCFAKVLRVFFQLEVLAKQLRNLPRLGTLALVFDPLHHPCCICHPQCSASDVEHGRRAN